LASLALVVVLPLPCRPTIMMPVRPGLGTSVSGSPSAAIIESSSSWQILMKCSAGPTVTFWPFTTAEVLSTSPMAFSLTC
jgi:hypothetical protein